MNNSAPFEIKLLTTMLISVCFLCFMISGCKPSGDRKSEEHINVNNQSRDQYLDWFREAKFGMFIHWGPYSRLAGEWNGQRQNESQAEWIMKYLKIPVGEYRDLAHKMNPVKFNAKEWIQLAKSTGMKYIVVTAKHHDGFAMYHSKVSDYNIVDWTPFRRDPLKELADACKAEGIKFCVYYSHREDWDHPGGYGNNWDYDNDWGDNLFPQEKFTRYLEEKAKPQLRELLTNYGPVGLVWFDRGMYTPEQGRSFVKLVNDIQPACLINSRVGNYGQELLGDYQSMADNGMPPGGLGEYWESAQTLNHTWGFNKFDTLWKSPETVIQRLVEIVSRGGNYLLNIGPAGEGEIPEATVAIFNKVGPWVKRNAESIYGAGANPFPEQSWGNATVKGNKLYLFVRKWPMDRVISITGFNNSVKSAYFLIDKSVKLPVRKLKNEIYIDLPVNPPDNPVSVITLEFEGTLKVDQHVVLQENNGRIDLNYLTVATYGKTKTRYNRKGNFHISKWTAPGDSARWNVNISKPGKFRLAVTYGANQDMEGQPFKIRIGGSTIRSKVVRTGEWFEFFEFPAGYIELKTAGNYTLTMHPELKHDNYLMYLRSVSLIPVPEIKHMGWGVVE